jgi:glycosyltransferase involved in cell wall biosynthesis
MIGKWHYSYFKYDSNLKYLIPYTGYALKRYLKKVKVNTVVSTRETVHFFLKEANNSMIKNKIYFFHTDANLVDGIFPGVIKKLNDLKLEKCAFVTEMNRQRYIEKLDFTNYDDYMVVGNSLVSSSIITKEEIHTVEKKDIYHGIYLTRISKDRVKDLDNAIEFAKYLKENKIDNIVIDVFGKGDYVHEFEDLIFNNELDEYLNYKGLTTNPHEELIKHDFAIDFSLNQSFGMTYIEGILNGLKTFAYHNYGSDEVLKEIKDSFIESNEDLVKKINNLPKIKREELVNNYEIITSKYSKEVVANKFLELVRK